MDEFIEHIEKLRPNGNTWMIYIKEEAKRLGLREGDDIGLVLCRPEDRDSLHERLNGSEPYMYFIAMIEGKPDIRKSLSLYELSKTLPGVTILGPFKDLQETRRFISSVGSGDPVSLFRKYIEG